MQQQGLFFWRIRTPPDSKSYPAAWENRVHGKASARCNSVRIRGASRNSKPGGVERHMEFPQGGDPLSTSLFTVG